MSTHTESTNVDDTRDVRRDPPEYLTIDELAEYLCVKKKLIYHWRVQGKGPRASKVGRALRYELRDVREWLSANKEQHVGDAGGMSMTSR
jgi:excisionase family DNA binding protein